MDKVSRLKTKREHLDAIVSSMAKLRNDCIYTDVTILCGDKEMNAHRLVLHAGSPYFRRMFDRQRDCGLLDILEIHGIDP